MKKTFMAIMAVALLAVTFQVSAVPMINMIIKDLNDATIENYTDGGSGVLAISSDTSALLSKYWDTGSIQVAAASNQEPSILAEFINASINLGSSILTGKNLIVIVEATEFVNPPSGPAVFDTVINASTILNASYDALVEVDNNVLLLITDISDTNTYEAIDTYNIGSPFNIIHEFALSSSAVGGDLGFDMSTHSATVPVPAPIALMGLSLIGMVGARKYLM